MPMFTVFLLLMKVSLLSATTEIVYVVLMKKTSRDLITASREVVQSLP